MNTIWIVLPVLLVLMFQLGIELDGAAFRRVAKHPKALFVGLAGQLLLLPAAAFAVGTLFRLPPVYFMGLMLIACCPGGSSSNVFSMLAKGDVALSVTLTALSSIITLFTIPPVMAFAARIVERHTETSIDLPVAKLILQNIVLLFLPMAAGALFRRLRSEAAGRVSAVLKRVAFPALMLLAALFFLQYTREIVANIASLGACAARKSFSKSARLAMLGKLIANTFQEALILLRLFLDRGLCRSKTLLIFSKFKLIGKLKRNPLNFLVKKTYLQAFLQQLRQQSYYDYQ